ncbi:MAG: hypothetical protein K0R76_562 [Alphaproteobacteria bacterium]|jgi:hypothetical protein|nr:hypothetical protein [Alphaproteobacteria bacterium]
MLLAYTLLGGSALLIIHHDIQTQTIPLYALAVFILSGLLKHVWDPDLEGFWAAGAVALILVVCQGLFFLLRREPAVGWGDLLLSPFCGLWLYLHEIPSFLLGMGLVALVMGIFWRYRWGMRTFPMAPAILSGLGIIFLIRCFLMMNGI